MLVSFNDCNIIQFKNKTTSSEYFYEVHKVVLNGISANMASLIQNRNFGAINAADTTTLGYYIVDYFSYTLTIQEYITTDGKISESGELVVRA